jgi:hypothetical protein
VNDPEAFPEVDDEADDMPLSVSARLRTRRVSIHNVTVSVSPEHESEGESGFVGKPSNNNPLKRPAQFILNKTASTARDAKANKTVKASASNNPSTSSRLDVSASSSTSSPLLNSALPTSTYTVKTMPVMKSSSSKSGTALQPSSTERRSSIPKHTADSSSLAAQLNSPVSTASTATKGAIKAGADLFSNWTAPPPKRTRTAPEDNAPRLYNLSAKWNAEKSGRNGAVLNADDISLVEPANIRELGRALAPPVQPRLVTNYVAPVVRPDEEEQTGSRIPLSCYRWEQNDICPLGPHECAFLHKNASESASEELYRQFIGHYNRIKEWRKFINNPENICRFWANKGCKKSNTECPVAHWYWTDSLVDRYKQQNPFKKPLTCFFLWQNGRCHRGEEECMFSHEYLPGSIAFGPGGTVPNDEPHRKNSILSLAAC